MVYSRAGLLLLRHRESWPTKVSSYMYNADEKYDAVCWVIQLCPDLLAHQGILPQAFDKVINYFFYLLFLIPL